MSFSVLPDPVRGIVDAISRAKRGRRKRNITKEALEWWGHKIGRLEDGENLSKRKFRQWRRGYGEAQVRKIVGQYHRWFKMSMEGE